MVRVGVAPGSGGRAGLLPADRPAGGLGGDAGEPQLPGASRLSNIGKNKRSASTLGLHKHSTQVVNGEGIPLKVPQIQYEAPDGQAEKGKRLEDRKTMRWIHGLRACAAPAGELEGVRVREPHNRSFGKQVPKLFDKPPGEAAQGRMEIYVARQDSRGQKQRKAREERLAQVELRWQALELPDPDGRGEAARLEWFLLTTLAVASLHEARRVLEWYRLRWRIEGWQRVLKSGCKVEYLGHRRGERIERAVTINAVIAWRLPAITLLGRDTPELPAETEFCEIEIAALADFAKDRRLVPPDNLGRAVLTLAMLGG